MARIRKSVPINGGYHHREHVCKKNRRIRKATENIFGRKSVSKKLMIEDIKVQEFQEEPEIENKFKYWKPKI